MTIQVSPGPLVTQGIQANIGTTTQTAGIAPPAYVSGSNENPDAGPNAFFAGSMLKDPQFVAPRMGSLTVGGYANQAYGWVESGVKTIDLVPSTLATANIAALQGNTLNTPLTLVSVTGAGITVLATPFVVPNTGVIIPAGALQIDAAPTWVGYGASGAMQGYSGGACGRALSITSPGTNLSAVHYTIIGWDLYGRVMSVRRVGPSSNTVNTLKAFKWIKSVTPDATNAGTVSVGTADIFEFPLRADRFSQVVVWWNETPIVVNTGFVAADVTSPATNLTGDVRGTYLVPSASDGTKRLVVQQSISPANIGTLTGLLGVTQV